MACEIDWAATGAMLQGEGALAQAAAIALAAWFGSQTLKQWRKQKVAEHRMEQARRIAHLIYQAQLVLTNLRRSEVVADEMKAAEEELVASDPNIFDGLGLLEKSAILYRRGLTRRVKAAHPFFKELLAAAPFSRAYFDPAVLETILTLTRQPQTIIDSIDHFGPLRGNNLRTQRAGRDVEAGRQGPNGEPNELDEELDRAMRVVEDHLIPEIRGTSS